MDFKHMNGECMSCPFCDENVIKSQTIAESDHCYVLQNIRPANFGQCLVVPKRHVLSIRELSQEELLDLSLTVQRMSKIVMEKLNPIGLNYGFNEGEYSGQSVMHFHFHIMPRFEGDKDKLPEYHLFHRAPETKRNLTEYELKNFVSRFKALIDA